MEVFPVLLQELADESLDASASGATSKKVPSPANGGKQNHPKVEGVSRGVITGASVNSDTDKLTETAKEFEAIFTAQLLSMMRDTANQTDFLGANSTSMKIFNSMLDEQYALRMAESGQLGLADMLVRQLSQYIDSVEGRSEGADVSLGDVDGQQAVANLEEVLEAVVSGLVGDGLENVPDIDLEALVASSQVIPDGELESVSVSETLAASGTEIDIEATDVVRFEDVVVSTEVNLDSLSEDEIAVSQVDSDSGFFVAVDMDPARAEMVEASSEKQDVIPTDSKGVGGQIASVEEEVVSVGLNQDFVAPENALPDVELSQQNVENALVSRQQAVDMDQTASRQFYVVQAPSADADSSENGESDLLRRARSRASLISSVRDFLVSQPAAEDGGRAALVELLANVGNGDQANLAFLQRLRIALMQLDPNQSNGQQQQQLDSQKVQLPSELVANAPGTVTNSVQNLSLSWSQIQNLDTNQLAALMNSSEGLNNASTLQLVNADRVMIQIVDKVSPQLARGMQEAVIDLEPPRLGRLHIRLLFEDSSLNARIHVRNVMVGEVVRGNLAQLRSVLADQGIQIDNFQVTTGSGDSQNGYNSHQSNQFNGWQENMGYRQGGWSGSNRDMDQMSQAIRQTMVGRQSSEDRQNVSDRSFSFDHLV
ncbi:MAG: flagellar hook-length control protein FliK [Candidatus Poribacteria bacterium]|nr:flagellar hook-length control protein FliK [Candidatus Poribacteria bacterium]